MSPCTIIAGPCSVDETNLKEIMQISRITVTRGRQKMRAIAGTRIVGLKSRTELSNDGRGMGMDYLALQKNIQILMNGGSKRDFVVPPSVLIAEEVARKTGMIIATEVMMPGVQLPLYEQRIPRGKLLPWSPAVNQLGWQIMETATYARRNGWMVGIKNGKWTGATMEKTWAGLCSYADGGRVILIHRGVDVPEKGDHRNLPVHQSARRVKKLTGASLFFDPSHAYGPTLRELIVPATIEAMHMRCDDGTHLYDGVLVEVGTSKTDTEQHITVPELERMAREIAKSRLLTSPDADHTWGAGYAI